MKQNKSNETILLAHGGGGKLTRDLIENYFLPAFSNDYLEKLGDSAVFSLGNLSVAFTTDTYVVRPIFFPGGNIGDLAICGTVNDLSVMGARPLFLSAGFILEEGFPINKVSEIINTMKSTAEKAGVRIVTGDTKVVEKGSADGIYINTSGIGIVQEELLSKDPVNPGDKIIINGTMGDHGISVLSAREDLPITSEIKSDTAPLNRLIFSLLEKFPGKVKFMRDATRGGVATVLNEFVEKKDFGVSVFEENIPVRDDVNAVCDLLGFDPLYIANEGKVIIVAENSSADKMAEYIKTLEYGANTTIIGEVENRYPGKVFLKTRIGGGRILDLLIGDQLPRIC
jgi:hydrogenase expression/formation protein HypE